jgi:hypothetical protein
MSDALSMCREHRAHSCGRLQGSRKGFKGESCSTLQSVSGVLLPVKDMMILVVGAQDLPTERSTFSFCMCPGKAEMLSYVLVRLARWMHHSLRFRMRASCTCAGGQVVPTSIDEKELCVNGMSFSWVSRPCALSCFQRFRSRPACYTVVCIHSSIDAGGTGHPWEHDCRRRQSKWANAAVVVETDASDWAHLAPQHGVLAGIALQQTAERCMCRELSCTWCCEGPWS